MQARARAWTGCLLVGLSTAACGSEDADETGTGGSAGTAGGAGALEGSCPDGFGPAPGKNEGFVSDDVERVFHLLLPSEAETPRPLFVTLTGTVQEELAFAAQSGLDELTASGFIVAAPVRRCSQDGTPCAQVGTDGRIWEPWYDGSAKGPSDDEGPDVRFVESMVRCIATSWPVDAKRVYVGGISAGGSFTNRNMTFNSDLFAGGVVSSGNWYGGLAAPATLPEMDPSIVIVIWGGPTDQWPPGSANDYNPETRQAAAYYAAQPDVVTVACSGTHGHVWPTELTPWLVDTLLAHPKDTDPSSFALGTPPAGFGCVVGEYTDH